MSVSALRGYEDFRDDDGGAVMVIGLCMACFLIGCLWFLIGIGDAIVFRDTMQEATDHAAFTSAALHAKGMNFIAALNVLLLALVAIHILLGIIHDIALAVCIISLGSTCGVWTSARKIYTGYFKGMKIAAQALSYTEKAAALGYPYLGLIKARGVGSQYGEHAAHRPSVQMVPIGTSLVPGNSLVSTVDGIFRTNSKTDETKYGLPVTARPMNALCRKLVESGFDFFNQAPLPFTVIPGATSLAKTILGGAVHYRYCNPISAGGWVGAFIDKAARLAEGEAVGISIGPVRVGIGTDGKPQVGKDNKPSVDDVDDPDKGDPKTGGVDLSKSSPGKDPVDLTKDTNKDAPKSSSSSGSSPDPGFHKFWGKDGPLVPWQGTKNGSPWQQVWAINAAAQFKDTSEHAVALAQRKYGVSGPTTRHTYYAQAEFYYDCTDSWTDNGCNGAYHDDGRYDNAGYSLRWRARLRRFDNTSLGFVSSIGGTLSGALQQISSLGDAIEPITSQLGSVGNAIDGVFDTVDHIGNTVDDVTNSNPVTATPYH